MDRIRKAMEKVTTDESGTAYGARIEIAGMEMAGKTGTAQVRSLAGGSDEHTECMFEDYRNREHSLFVGYAPIDKPRYACAVIIEHGCSGSSTAAPIARDVLTIAQYRDSQAPGVSMPNRPSLREIEEARQRAQDIIDRRLNQNQTMEPDSQGRDSAGMPTYAGIDQSPDDLL